MNKKRTSEKVEILDYNITEIWNTITNNENFQWRTDVKDITRVDEITCIETTHSGHQTQFEIIEKTEPTVYRFNMKGEIFEGIWSGVLEEIGSNKTRLIFREEIVFKNNFFKMLSYIFLNLNKIQEQYFSDLKRKLGEKQ